MPLALYSCPTRLMTETTMDVGKRCYMSHPNHRTALTQQDLYSA